MADRIETPYLNAIQAVPGDTPSEKFKWIAELIKERLPECNSLEDVIETEKIPSLLKPLVQVQAALMLNKKNRENQSAYEAIAEALKSEDELVVNRALQASRFFDGSNITITNTRYFFDSLFPYVSLKTRTRIIKILSAKLAPRNSALAEEFFTAVASFYGLEQALPLLLACSESFMYNTIVERRIVLHRRMIKQIFRKNPDFVVRYLRLSKPITDPCVRNLHPVTFYNLGDFLSALIKKRLEAFVELYEMHEKSLPSLSLSKRCAEAFIKNGKEYLERKPRLYFKLLPLKMISNSRMEAIFSKLFPDKSEEVDIDEMLSYLEYYPQDKKGDFFLKSYQQAYGKSILDDPNKVTGTLMTLLTPEERVRQARIKLANSLRPHEGLDYQTAWQCYLSVEESMPQFKEEIARTSEMEVRAAIAARMIYLCKVNKDDQALLDVLAYIHNRHKNEQPRFLMKVFETLLDNYDLPQMGQEHWTVLLDMIVRAHVKDDLLASTGISSDMLEAAIYHKILQNEPIDQLIDILVDVKSSTWIEDWNILRDHPEYTRMCLEACVKCAEQKYKSKKVQQTDRKIWIPYGLCSSIYEFNKTYVNKTSRVERMTVKNYPWLVEAVEKIASTKDQQYTYMITNLQNVLRPYEKDLYDRLWPEEDRTGEVEIAKAVKILERNPEEILNRWKEYYDACNRCSHTKRFLKAIRWYKDIPIKFAQQCLQDLTEKENESCLEMLATLVHGETFAKIIEPFLPSNKTIDTDHKEAQTNYLLVYYIIHGMKIVNPPVSLAVLGRLCEGDYLSLALQALRTVCRRMNSRDVISFARTLISQRVSVRKHGIRLLYMIMPRDQLIQFLLSQCKTEENNSIREIIFIMALELFQKEPGPAAWSLFVEIFSTLTLNDDKLLRRSVDLLITAPDEYVVDYLKLALSAIDKFDTATEIDCKCKGYITDLLSRLNTAVCNCLPEDLIEKLMRRFFFHYNSEISNSVHYLVKTALVHATEEKFLGRMKMFSSVFTETVKSGWNVPHPKYPRFYPVNCAVYQFVGIVAYSSSNLDLTLPVLDGILSAFNSVLTPHMDAKSYLLLVYTMDRLRSKAPKEFGIRLGQRLPELVRIFSPLFLFFMSETLQSLLEQVAFQNCSRQVVILEVVEGLMEVDAALMAVNLFTYVKPKNYGERHDKLMTKFREHDDPVIKSIACDIINKIRLRDLCNRFVD